MILAEFTTTPSTHTNAETHAHTQRSGEQLERRIPAQLMHNKEHKPNQTISKQAGKVKQNSSSRCCEAPNTGVFSPDPGPPLPRDGSTTRPTWPASPEQTLITERLRWVELQLLSRFLSRAWMKNKMLVFLCLFVSLYLFYFGPKFVRAPLAIIVFSLVGRVYLSHSKVLQQRKWIIIIL